MPTTLRLVERRAADPAAGGSAMNVGGAIEKYVNARRGQLARRTIVGIRYQLGIFAEIVGRDLDVTRVNVRHLDKWDAARDRAPSTTITELSILRTWFRWLHARGHITHDPTLGWTPPRAPRLLPRELTHDQVCALFAVLPDARARLVVSLMVSEGLRVGEVVAIEINDIDPHSWIMRVIGKGSHERQVVVSADTQSALRCYLHEWPRRRGVPLVTSYTEPRQGLTANALSRLVARWMREAGIKDAAHDGKSGHALRHTAAGRWLDDGADPRDVQHTLGHASLGSTWAYTRRRQSVGRQRDFIGKHSYFERDEAPPREGGAADVA